MSAKLYVAGYDVTLGPINSGLDHAYIFYDADGDLSTKDDQKIIRGGPKENYSGSNHNEPDVTSSNIIIELRNDARESYDYAFDANQTPADQDFRLLWSGQAATDAFNQMWDFAHTIGDAMAGQNELYETGIDYDLVGPNSNSVVNTMLNIIGMNFRVNTPHADGSVTTYQDPSEYPGHMGLLDGSGDNVFVAYVYEGGLTETTVFHKRDGNDTILLEWNNVTNVHAELEIENTGLSAGMTKVYLHGLNYADVVFEKSGNTLKVTMGWNPFDDDLVRVIDFYKDYANDAIEGAQTSAFEFEDLIYYRGDDNNNTFHVGDKTKDVLLEGFDGRDTASYADITGGGVMVTMVGTNGTVTAGADTDTLTSIEIIEGTAGDDYFAGGDAKVLFIGGAGSDRYFLSESSPIYLLEQLGDTGTDVLLVNGATPDVSYGTTSSRGTWVEGENGAPSFFIPKAIEEVNGVSASAYTDTHGPTNISATADGGYKLFVNSEKDNVWNTSPLVLDLDNNGITLAPLYGEGSVYFDIDNDGMAEAVGWVSGNDGLLVIDKDGNGTIDDRSELFGNKHNYDYLSQSQTWNYDNGFETLKDYDSNNDARITATDDSFSDLLVWIDVNSDGVSQAGELHTLSSLSITEISTNYEIINEENQGNYIYQEGSFYINGNRQNISDVWFSYDNLNSQYTGEISIGADIVYLPDLRGYGQLSDLQIAMSDNTDLAALMSDYIAQDYAPEDIGSHAQILELKDVLYEWAGVRGLDLSNRMAHSEFETTGNDVAFLEAYFDRAYDNGGLVYNVGVITIFRALNNIMDDMSAQIFFQSAASDYLFVQKPFYNSVTHDFSNNFVFDIAAFEAKILMFAEDDISRLKFVANTLTMFKSALGFDNLSAADITELESLVSDTLSYWGVTLPQASNISIVASVHSVTENGTELNDLLVGRDGFVDSLYGGDGDDVLIGLAGGSTLYGGEGNDRLYGGDGNDGLYGGHGDDVYFFSKGSDIARDTSGFDTLLFGEGISFSDLTIEKRDDGSYFGTTNHLVISDGAGNSILFNQQFNAISSQLDTLQFADGTTIQLSSIEIDSHGTEGNDSISGIETGDLSTDDIMFGHGGNDTLSGNSGDDILYGGSGDDYLSGGLGSDIAYGGIGDDYITGGDSFDILHGNDGDDRLYGQEGDDTLFGGDGNDTLYGDDTFSSYAGNDTYYAGSGNDIINDRYGDDTYYYTAGFDTINDSDGTDVIILTEGVISGDIQVFNAGASDLLITINSIMSQGQIYIYGQRLSGEGIEALTLFDGTSISLTGTNAVNEIYGTFNADTNLQGDLSGVQNDHIHGLLGDDQLHGLSGNDTYYYTAGLDEIWDTDGLSDTIILPENVNISDLIISRVDSDNIKINLIGDVRGTIIVHDYYTAADTIEYIQFYNGSQISLVETVSDDQIYGTIKDEVLSGDISGITDDFLRGLSGDDQLSGGDGNDTYVWSVGDGNDTITETNGVDTLIMQDIVASDLSFAHDINGNALQIRVNDETITITNQFYSDAQQNSAYDYYQIETLLLDDSTEIDLTNIVTFTGTSESDALYGTHSGDDTLEALAGDDILNGYEGNDTYVWSVGDGNDTITEAGGVDKIVLHGVSEDDLRFEYSTSPENLKIYIGNEVITINSQYSAEAYQIETLLLDDSTEINLLENMTFVGTDTDDYVYGLANSDNILIGLGGNDRLYGGGGNDILNGDGGNDILYGYAGDDILNGGAGNDAIYGYDGNDIIRGGEGDDFIQGMGGIDQVIFSGSFENYTIVTSGYQGDAYGILTVTDNVGADGIDVIYSVEQLIFTNRIYENGTLPIALDDVFSGYQGLNVTGNVLVDNGNGADAGPVGGILTVVAGTYITAYGMVTISTIGDFTYSPNTELIESDSFTYIIKNEFGDQDTGLISWTLNPIPQRNINGTSGDDTLFGNPSGVSNDTINGLAGNDTIHGLSGHDYISGNTGNDYLSGSSGNDSLFGGTGNDVLLGGTGNDFLEGGSGGDGFNGGSGNDILIGGLNYDQSFGGEGDDTYIFRVGDSSSQASGSSYAEEYVDENEGEGVDTIKIEGVDSNDARIWTTSSGEYRIKYSDTDEIRLVSTVLDRSVASTFEFIEFDDGTIWDLRDGLYVIDTDDDRIYNSLGHISGAATDDYFEGRGGNDEIHGQGGDDHILGGEGDDRLYGEGRNVDGSADYGVAGNDTLEGEGGDDYLSGGIGDDILIGGVGNDSIQGGAGFDQAIFSGAYEDYTVTQILHPIFGYFLGGYKVTALVGNDGVDSVYDAEELVFANGRYVYDTFILNGQYTDNINPIAQDDAFSGVENTTVVGNLFADNGNGLDVDADGDVLHALAITIRSTSDAQVIIQENGDFEYIANTNFNGTDSFAYVIYDQKGGQSTATVSITIAEVNNPPIAHDDNFIGSQNINLIGNVINGLGNTNIRGSYFYDQSNVYDSDPDADILSVTAGIYATSNGSVMLLENGDFTYTPDVGFTGADSFIYTLNDSAGNTSNASVNIHVYQDAQIDDLVGENYLVGDQGGRANDTILGHGGNDYISAGHGNDQLFGHDGSDTLYGSYDNDYLEGGVGDDNLYGSSGNDVYFYSLGDGDDDISEDYISDEDYFAGASNGGYDTVQFGAGINYWDIQQTWTGYQNGDLELNIQNQGSITIQSQNTGGARVQVEQLLFEDGSQMSLVNYTGHVLYVKDYTGPITFVPNTSYNDVYIMQNNIDYIVNGSLGADEVVYALNFDDITFVDNGTNVTVQHLTHIDDIYFVEKITFADGIYENGVFTSTGNSNTGSIATDDVVNVNEDTSVTVDVLANDVNVNDDILTVSLSSTAPNGLLVMNDDNTITYTPNADYNGVDSFTYTIDDGNGGTSTATVNLIIAPVNDAPVAQDDVFSGDQDLDIIGNFLVDNGGGVDSDPEGDTLIVIAETITTTNGSVVISANGDFTYTPSAGYSGVDSFNYTLQSGNGGTSTATVNITIDPVNDTPVAQDDVFSGVQDLDITGSLLVDNGNGADSDPDGDVLSIVAGTYSTANGSITVGANGDFTYTPNIGYIGTDSFDYTLEDGNGSSDVGNVALTINSIHDTFISTSSADSFDGGDGNDTIDYSASDAGIIVDLLNNAASGGYAAGDTLISIENLIGSDFGDIITGTGDDNILQGGIGDDEYHYISGNDTIVETGGADDALYLDISSPSEADPDRVKLVRYMTNADDLQIRVDLSAASDESDVGTILVENYFDESSDAGRIEHIVFNDAVDMPFYSFKIITFANGSPANIDGVSVGNHQQDIIYGTLATENINAGDGVDFVYGNGGGDTIHGGNAGDALYGWNGNDVIYGDAGDDYIFGDDNATNAANTGADILSGGAGSDWLEGEKGNDTIYGGTETDYLLGGEGDDLLYGEGGDDHLFGDVGADTFIWLAGDIGAVDTVYDFNIAEGDKLNISDLLSGYDAVNDAITDFVQISESGSNSFLNIDVDGGGDNFVNIAFLYNVTGLSDEDALETSGNLIAA